MKFWKLFASLYLHILTSFGQFIFIFNKMALIFLGVLIVFTMSSFTKSDCLDFITNEVPIHPTSINWIISFGENAGVLSQAAAEAKNSL